GARGRGARAVAAGFARVRDVAGRSARAAVGQRPNGGFAAVRRIGVAAVPAGATAVLAAVRAVAAHAAVGVRAAGAAGEAIRERSERRFAAGRRIAVAVAVAGRARAEHARAVRARFGGVREIAADAAVAAIHERVHVALTAVAAVAVAALP